MASKELFVFGCVFLCNGTLYEVSDKTTFDAYWKYGQISQFSEDTHVFLRQVNSDRICQTTRDGHNDFLENAKFIACQKHASMITKDNYVAFMG